MGYSGNMHIPVQEAGNVENMEIKNRSQALSALQRRQLLTDKKKRRALIERAMEFAPEEARKALALDKSKGLC